MSLAPLRLLLVLTALSLSVHAAGETRFWTLNGVKFSDGAAASGIISYDDATQKIANYHVHVDQGFVGGEPQPLAIQSLTYVPGDALSYTYQSPFAVSRTLVFAMPFRVTETGIDDQSDFGGRILYVTPLAALDGSSESVPLLVSILEPQGIQISGEDFGVQNGVGRRITAGSLTLTSLPPPVMVVQVDEFYHAVSRHYFITADDEEKQKLDTDVHAGWVRTGNSFKAYAAGSALTGSISPVCRYYGDPQRGIDSHFFSADAGECAAVQAKYGTDWRLGVLGVWQFESDDVFEINLPDKPTGSCPSGTIPVYRLWNQRADSNHRYTTSVTIKTDMLASGYLAEGYGPNGVAMCAVQ